MTRALASGALSPDSGWILWFAEFSQRMKMRDGLEQGELAEAFRAGYELARSQSTQGSGFWNPATGMES